MDRSPYDLVMSSPAFENEMMASSDIPGDRLVVAPPRDRSPNSKKRIRVKNRRKRYLDLHPEYFSSDLEFADPLAYDGLVRRFQTPAERETDGKRKGYSGTLEADLWRSEAKIQALANPSVSSMMTYRRGEDGVIVAEAKEDVPQTKEEGLRRWQDEMELRFLRGDDEDFSYPDVDQSEEFDDRGVEEREEEEKWFEEEEPHWVDNHGGESEGKVSPLRGETGIQDF